MLPYIALLLANSPKQSFNRKILWRLFSSMWSWYVSLPISKVFSYSCVYRKSIVFLVYSLDHWESFIIDVLMIDWKDMNLIKYRRTLVNLGPAFKKLISKHIYGPHKTTCVSSKKRRLYLCKIWERSFSIYHLSKKRINFYMALFSFLSAHKYQCREDKHFNEGFVLNLIHRKTLVIFRTWS